jgi:hypothetical protein
LPFSSKPSGGYKDYYEKMATYAAIVSGPAKSIDPTLTEKGFRVIESNDDVSVFKYLDTSSSRAGIVSVSRKLELDNVAIVGLGGTGSFVLDLIAKTPVKKIHLFDGDQFSQHNAFRSPGAASVEELRTKSKKVVYFQQQYSKMRQGVIAHDYYIDATNIDELRSMDFVFICLDNGAARKFLVEKLDEFDLSFIDVGMGVQQVDEALIGILRVTSSTSKKREHLKVKVPFSTDNDNNDYSRNIQLADLNALNAALAVIKWKKLLGFYLDLENEYHSMYTLDGNMLTNEDQL